jgi:hypothetical protein
MLRRNMLTLSSRSKNKPKHETSVKQFNFNVLNGAIAQNNRCENIGALVHYYNNHFGNISIYSISTWRMHLRQNLSQNQFYLQLMLGV